LLAFHFGRTIDGGSSETEIDIEVWDWDRWTPDDRIGSLRVKLGDLASARGTTIDLSPPLNGCILVRSAEFREIAGVPTTMRKDDVMTIYVQKSDVAKLKDAASPETPTGALVMKVMSENSS
jgi:hypothetical protein